MSCQDRNVMTRDGEFDTSLEVLQLRERNNELAQMLCSLCQLFEDPECNETYTGEDYFFKVPGLPEWWEKHRKPDPQTDEEEDDVDTDNLVPENGDRFYDPKRRRFGKISLCGDRKMYVDGLTKGVYLVRGLWYDSSRGAWRRRGDIKKLKSRR